MCGLFGFIDFKNQLSARQKTQIVRILAKASETRGMDATGIAYCLGSSLHIYKRAIPAHCMHFSIPYTVTAVLGHTRAATQGSANYWRNNHPFEGSTIAEQFALAHNGVISNDKLLRLQQALPRTEIETDSYIAVQLLEQNPLSLNNLGYMAEQLEGTFSFTILDNHQNFYFIKGNSPICIYQFEKGIYLYASTEDILKTALRRLRMNKLCHNKIPMDNGDLLMISPCGTQKSQFHLNPLFQNWGFGESICDSFSLCDDDIYNFAEYMGLDGKQVDQLYSAGLSSDEIAELLDDPWLLKECIKSL